MDYFISNKFNEPDNAQNNYTENLVLFDNMFISGSLDQSLKYIPKQFHFQILKFQKEKNTMDVFNLYLKYIQILMLY